jgi:hypothetical protein
MKIIAAILILTIAVLICGCISAAPQSPVVPVSTPHPDPGPGAYTTPHAIPNLLGNWTGPARGFTKGIGYRDTGTATGTMSVTFQKDRAFAGNFTFPVKNGSYMTEGFAGVIAHDGETIRIVEFDTHEHDDGWILSENEIELVFIDIEEPQSVIIDSLKRSS